MKNIDVIQSFFNGYNTDKIKTKNLRIISNPNLDVRYLINYETAVACLEGETVIVLKEKISKTTTMIVNQVIKEASNRGLLIIKEKIQML